MGFLVIVAASRLLFRLLMAKSPAKYVVVKNGKDLLFQRKVPKQIVDKLSLKSGKVYQRALGLTLGCSDTELNKALANAHELFLLYVRKLENSSASAMSDSEIDILAMDYLRRIKARTGSLVTSKQQGTDVGKVLEGDADQVYYLAERLQVLADPDADDQTKAQAALSIDEQVQWRIAEKLTEAEAYRPTTFSSLASDYYQFKQLDTNAAEQSKLVKRNKAKVVQRINKFLSYIGEQFVNDKAGGYVQVALRNYCEDRLEAKVKTSSIKRELNDIKAFINYAINEYSLSWAIRTPNLPKQSAKTKTPLTEPEQTQLIEYALNEQHGKPHLGVACLLYLQGGLMASEMMHLTVDNGNLTDLRRVAYLNANHDITKTEARKRIVPIVIGAKYIRQHLQETTEWLKRTTDTNHSHQIKKFLGTATGNETLTGHCLRHTFKLNIQMNEADLLNSCAIAGWSGSGLGLSQHMINYGNKGLEDKPLLKRLQATSKQIHIHLKKYFD